MHKFLAAILLLLIFSSNSVYHIKTEVWLLTISVDCYAKEKDSFVIEAETLRDKFAKGIMPLYKLHKKSVLDKNATRKNCLAGFEWLKQANSDDIVIVYIGCHGSVREKGYYFLTYENKIYGSEIKKYLENLPCMVILIVDTCHAGALIDEWQDSKSNIICSTKGSDIAVSWQLTVALTEALDGAADYDSNGVIDLNEIRQYITKRVPEMEGHQHPILSKKPSSVILAKLV